MRAARFLLWCVIAAQLAGQCPPPGWWSANQHPGLGSQGYAMTLWDADGAGSQPARTVIAGNYPILPTSGLVLAPVSMWDGAAWQTLGAGMSDPVYALATYNGALIAGGHFQWAGVTANRIARFDGTAWQPLGAGLDGDVFALAEFNGDLIAGGAFMNAGGVPANRVARWNGSTWQPLGAGFDGDVLALLVHNGQLYAGGAFGTSGATLTLRIARWDGSSWVPVGSGVDNVVRAFTVLNGDLIVGGGFTGRVAWWNGAAWQGVGAPVWNNQVTALAIYNGSLIAGGSFTTAGGAPANRIARFDGSAWQPLGTGMTAEVVALGVNEGDLWATGHFNISGGVAAQYVGRWNGTAWQSQGPGIAGQPLSMTSHLGRLVVGGLIWLAGGNPARAIAGWDGTTWNTFGGGMASTTPNNFGVVHELAVHNAELVAGGTFDLAGGTPATNVARWDGMSWQALGSGTNDAVLALASYNSELVAGGFFTTAGGGPANRIAHWNGISWSQLGTSGINGGYYPTTVWALALHNGQLIAGGHFALADAVAVNNIARWDGVAWNALGGGVSGQPSFPVFSTLRVYALAVYNGDLVAAGDFSTAGGMPASNIARWDGTAWSPLAQGVSGVVRDLAVHNGKLFAAGSFSGGIASWDGSSWQALGSGMAGSPAASADAVESHEGSVFIAGYFSGAGGLQSPLLARWGTPPGPILTLSQPGGSGSWVLVAMKGLLPGHEYFNVASLDVCGGGPGTGPYGGLCFNDVSVLVQQIQAPLGTPPFHFAAAGTTLTFGPYPVPTGVVIEAISVDVTGGVLGCPSPTVHFPVY